MDKLGEPLTIESIDAKDAFNKTEGNRLQVNNQILLVVWDQIFIQVLKRFYKVKLPITGKTRAADLFIYADKLSDEDRK